MSFLPLISKNRGVNRNEDSPVKSTPSQSKRGRMISTDSNSDDLNLLLPPVIASASSRMKSFGSPPSRMLSIMDNKDIVIEECAIYESLNENQKAICVEISKGAEMDSFINIRWRPKEAIEKLYASYLVHLKADGGSQFNELLQLTLAKCRFEDGFTQTKAAVILGFNKNKMSRLWAIHRDSNC
jgi:hypothetical protein